MSHSDPHSPGKDLAQRLREACAQVTQAALPGARQLPVLTGLTQKCLFVEPLENVLARGRQILVQGGRVYAYGGEAVYEVGEGPDKALVPLTRGRKVEPWAASLLANELVCQHHNADGEPMQFAPPGPLIGVLLHSAPTLEALPVVRVYATRPVFDEQFVLHGPGWHPATGCLVHGPDIDPTLSPPANPGLPVRERLPHHLRTLLGDFCFKAEADWANAVAALLTGLLVACFVSATKPVVLLDGNQPSVGKTWLARVIGIVLDGIDPQLIHFTPDDEELAKRICATLRGSPQSVLLIDNAKVRGGGAISSPVLEANSMAPQIALRILGRSANYTRPNDLVWLVTMNDTKASSDLVSRGVPVRFRYDGDPRQRDFQGRDPIRYAREHRAEILGELMGMVVGWNQQGRPPGPRKHRCTYWAEVVGGILQVAGLPEFLENLDEAAAAFNQALDQLAALAEAVAAAGDPALIAILDSSEGGDS